VLRLTSKQEQQQLGYPTNKMLAIICKLKKQKHGGGGKIINKLNIVKFQYMC